MTDDELLGAWAGGDDRAGSQLFDRHFECLYGFFRNKAGGAVEDLIQETMLACVRARDAFRGDASFRTYLFTIARHQLYAHYRAQSRRATDEEIGARSIADLGTSPSGVFARKRDHDLLLRALRAIPLDLQVALELHFWEELSGPEMALVLGVPEGTVRSRIRRGKELLEATMRDLVTAGEEAQLEASSANLEGWAAQVRRAIDRPA